MDIGSGNGYPESALSNFAPNKFIFEGIECASREGFLQSLKFSNPEMQKHVCTLVGIKAKMKGKNKAWWRTQTLWWKGQPLDRHSQEYQDLIDRAFEECAKQCESFRKALLASGNATLGHSIGKNDSSRTVLTQREFCSRLTTIREQIKKGII